MMIAMPNVTSSGGRTPRSRGEVEQAALQHVAEAHHHRHDDDQGQERVDAGGVDQHQRQERSEDAQVAVGQVDQAHDAEDQRQAGREQGVEAAEQHALDDGVEPVHRQIPK